MRAAFCGRTMRIGGDIGSTLGGRSSPCQGEGRWFAPLTSVHLVRAAEFFGIGRATNARKRPPMVSEEEIASGGYRDETHRTSCSVGDHRILWWERRSEQ